MPIVKLLRIFTICLIACNSKEETQAERSARIAWEEKYRDSVKSALTKDIDADLEKEAVFKSDSAPVKILKSWVADDYAKVVLRNDAKDAIDGVKIWFHCYNNFGEKVGDGGGLLQKTLKPGKTGQYEFYLTGMRGTTKIIPAIHQIHFIDGSTWGKD